MSVGLLRVLADSNVLYSRTLRDWLALLYLAPGGGGLFEVVWTEDIMAEVLYHLRKNNPFLDDEQVGGVRRRLAAVFATGLITGYQIDSSTGYPDVYDAHVHCAAVHGRADIIVTGNVRDFTGMDEQPYEVYSPDDFFVLVDDSAPETVLSALRTQLRYYREKGGRFSLPEQLRTANAPQFAERVRQHMHRIDINTI
ncbi:PIN domain-containing protein [Hoyosella sp. YIM 151337]|uniref:PIN domain-containing protein n=1 Tax=Hoyosella sp. YIM 151337 TaxID=2992742 RepID=UPI0022365F28|nr:PIN domain-containing protein [Hoyosella sp. YIM 151337]MCW4355228.1 PIN domain-containing protein [Hoyosella sp. YIM 151337]